MTALGICLENNHLLIAAIKRKGSSYDIKTQVIELEDFEKVKQFYNPRKITSALSSKEVLLRCIEIPLLQKKQLLKALPFQAETHLPFAPEETLLCPLAFNNKERSTEVSFLAASQSSVHEHLLMMQNIGIDPDQISCSSIALTHFVKHFYSDLVSALVVYVAEGSVTLVLIENQQPVFSYAAPLFSEAEAEKKWQRLLQTMTLKEGTSCLLLGDPPCYLQDLTERSLPTIIPEQRAFALAIGLALDTTLQFRHQTPSFDERQKRKKWFVRYVASFLCMSAILFFLAFALKIREEASLSERVSRHFPSSLPLEDRILLWQRQLGAQKAPPSPSLPWPRVSEALLACSAPHEGIDILSLRYSIESETLDLEFLSQSSKIAESFYQSLLVSKLFKEGSKMHEDPSTHLHRLCLTLKKQKRL